MCGIVGLFLKDPSLEAALGRMLTDMLVTMSDRGPDSAGIAIYSKAAENRAKITIQSAHPDQDFAALEADFKTTFRQSLTLQRKNSHAVFEIPQNQIDEIRARMREAHPGIRVMSLSLIHI